MVLFGGLEVLAAGYLIHDYNKKKREKQRLEEEEEFRRAHRRRRRHSDEQIRPSRTHHEDGRKHRKSSHDRHSSKPTSTPSSSSHLTVGALQDIPERASSMPPPGYVPYFPPSSPSSSPSSSYSLPQAGHLSHSSHPGLAVPPLIRPQFDSYSEPSKYLPPNHYPPPPPLPSSSGSQIQQAQNQTQHQPQHQPQYQPQHHTAPLPPSALSRRSSAPAFPDIPLPEGAMELVGSQPDYYPQYGRPRPNRARVRFEDELPMTPDDTRSPPPPYREW